MSAGPLPDGARTRPPEPWREAVACRAHPTPDDFHPVHADPLTLPAGHTERAGAERALALCAGCPVRVPCYEWALHVGDGYAILGGTTPAQREHPRAGDPRRRALRVVS